MLISSCVSAPVCSPADVRRSTLSSPAGEARAATLKLQQRLRHAAGSCRPQRRGIHIDPLLDDLARLETPLVDAPKIAASTCDQTRALPFDDDHVAARRPIQKLPDARSGADCSCSSLSRPSSLPAMRRLVNGENSTPSGCQSARNASLSRAAQVAANFVTKSRVSSSVIACLRFFSEHRSTGDAGLAEFGLDVLKGGKPPREAGCGTPPAAT
jgi:hypothetical protein